MRTRSLALAAIAASALTVPATAPAAELLHGVTDDGRLVHFTSDAPGAVDRGIAITGLQPGEQVVGLDERPSTGALFALGSTSRLYRLDPLTGAARLVGGGPFAPPLAGAAFGFDFNPVADRIRVTSDVEQNMRLNPDNGTVAGVDAPLQYAAGDPGAGTNPSITGAAYTNPFPGATSTTLLDVDTARDALVRQDPPNMGTLRTIGALGIDATDPLGFDIASNGVAYLATGGGTGPSSLFVVDLNTGRATPATARPVITVPAASGSGLSRVRAIAAAGQVPNDTTRPGLSVAFSSTILERNTNVLRPSVSCTEACTIAVRATVEGRAAGSGSAAIIGGAGRVTVLVPLNAAARRRIARPGTELIRLSITATDAAGNATSLTKISRTQTPAARRGR